MLIIDIGGRTMHSAASAANSEHMRCDLDVIVTTILGGHWSAIIVVVVHSRHHAITCLAFARDTSSLFMSVRVNFESGSSL